MGRGSEWHKWDLHIHTPGTLKNDQFGNSEVAWSEYIRLLEESDIAAFGITDYFSIDNYLKVREYQRQGRLHGIFILPNVELRITPVTRAERAVNIHVIFDPSFTEEELNREFFREMKIEYQSENYSCLREDLVRFGRKLTGDEDYPEHAAIREAIDKFHISHEKLRDILRKIFFRNRIIVALSNSSNDGISGLLGRDGGLDATKKEICRMSDVIMSGNPNDVKYFLGEKTSIDEVVSSYGSIKPCITGSDAHTLENVGKFYDDRITWIKATLTFDGLRQILFEPKERVAISATKPDEKFDYNVIDHVEVCEHGIWHQKIYFNQNLNAIIGGRSTGKSTLLSSIARKLGILSHENGNEFIDKLSEGVKVIWRNSQESTEKTIEYFSQNYLTKVAEKQLSSLLLKILLGDPAKKDKYDRFNEGLSAKYRHIQSGVALYFEKRRVYEEKFESLKCAGNLSEIKIEIDKLQKERDQIQSRLKERKNIFDVFEKMEKDRAGLMFQKQQLENDIEKLNQVSSQIFLSVHAPNSASMLTEKNKCKLEEFIKEETNKANNNIAAYIQSTIDELTRERENVVYKMKLILESNDYIQGKLVLDENECLVRIVENLEKLNIKFNSIKKMQDELDALKREFHIIGQKLIDTHISYLDDINDIAANMIMQREDVKIQPVISWNDNLKEMLDNCLSLKHSSTNEIIDKMSDVYRNKVKSQIKEVLYGLMSDVVRGNLHFKGGYDAGTFVSKVLSECWYGLSFDVEYDGDNLKFMSPGKRSFVVLKLILDFSDKECPILIDQPEDNLDNRDIYTKLVKYIRKKKKERQIILVTHNPNIVVGADSEEVIVANQHGANSPNANDIKFQYESGALEDSKPRETDVKIPTLLRCGIREHVCDILEGGEEAFRSREHKYGF